MLKFASSFEKSFFNASIPIAFKTLRSAFFGELFRYLCLGSHIGAFPTGGCISGPAGFLQAGQHKIHSIFKFRICESCSTGFRRPVHLANGRLSRARIGVCRAKNFALLLLIYILADQPLLVHLLQQLQLRARILRIRSAKNQHDGQHSTQNKTQTRLHRVLLGRAYPSASGGSISCGGDCGSVLRTNIEHMFARLV